MKVEYDDTKRTLILEERGLDIAGAGKVFEGFHLTKYDLKHSLEEERFNSIGLLDGDVVIVTWTPRKGHRRIVTMWKADDKERTRYHQERDRPG